MNATPPMTNTTAASSPAPTAISDTIGFIGLGVMGGAMCRNLMRRAPGARFLVHDPRSEAVTPFIELGAQDATVTSIAEGCDIVLLSLPNGQVVEQVLAQMLPHLRAGTVIVDTSTSPVDKTRSFAEQVRQNGARWVDAPIARTREAAESGTLSIMVGGSTDDLERVRPILECMGTDVSHCGDVGAGQVVKILNNMVLFQTVNALAEALAIARGAGVPGEVLFDVFSKGSADSFALRNHGMKSLLKDNFPLRAFSTRYARKDNSYALDLASGVGVVAEGALHIERMFEQVEAAGLGDHYFPVLYKLLGPGTK